MTSQALAVEILRVTATGPHTARRIADRLSEPIDFATVAEQFDSMVADEILSAFKRKGTTIYRRNRRHCSTNSPVSLASEQDPMSVALRDDQEFFAMVRLDAADALRPGSLSKLAWRVRKIQERYPTWTELDAAHALGRSSFEPFACSPLAS